MKRHIIFIAILAVSVFAQPYWTLEDFERFDESYSLYCTERPLFRDLDDVDVNISYPFKFIHACDFIAAWQLLDEDSSEYGGIIEAESGPLRYVIQTDNTQESVLVWSQLYNRFGMLYEDYIERSWIYIMNFPAYYEEVSSYSIYYPFWNCALALLMLIEYEEHVAIEDFSWYSDTCVAYLLDNFLPFEHEHDYFRRLHPVVTAFAAGCLYLWAEYVDDDLLRDRALFFAETAMVWIDEDPETRLATEVWAMCGGTVVWGLFNSYFMEYPEEAEAWLEDNYRYIPEWATYPTRYDPYLWDNSWSIWFANGYRSIYNITGDEEAYSRFINLVDYLLLQDEDDDGGITASAAHPQDEDMTWVTSYLIFMALDQIVENLPDNDIGVLDIIVHSERLYFLEGDTIDIEIWVANCGMSPTEGRLLRTYHETEYADDISLDLGERQEWFHSLILSEGGTHIIEAIAFADDDTDPSNDTIRREFEVVPLIEFGGTVQDYLGNALSSTVHAWKIVGDTIILHDSTTTNPATGSFEMTLPGLPFKFTIAPEYPAPTITTEPIVVSSDIVPYTFTLPQAHLLLVDNDGDEPYPDYEQYYMGALDSMGILYHRIDRRSMDFFADMLDDFQWRTLIWFTGIAQENTITETDQAEITTALESGGFAIISGQYISDELESTDFLSETVGVTLLGNSTRNIMYPAEGNPITGEFDLITTIGPGSAGNTESHDILSPISSTPIILTAAESDEATAVMKEFSSGGKLVYFGFGLENLGRNPSLDNPSDRISILRNCFAWFNSEWNIDEAISALPRYSAIKAYPNPFNSALSIEVHSDGLLEIMDISGRVVHSVEATAGQAIQWTPQEAPSGLYILRLTSGDDIHEANVLYIK